jgi:FlgD Ig-like domain
MRRSILFLICIALAPLTASAQHLFIGLEGSTPVTRSSNLAGFPEVVYQNHFNFDVSGAAATPEGLIYLCNGAFTTHLYSATMTDSPQQLSTISVDISALAYGNGTLWGFSNYATPKGIYEIDPESGTATLVLDVYTGTGFRFFALDYNQTDGLLYGYTEYGDSGLYSINLATGEMVKLAGTIPASNGQGRGMAVGNNTVYLTATRGDDDIPCFAYDIAQGIGGEWIPFSNPYPAYHSTGGAAWIPDPTAAVHPDTNRPPEWQLRVAAISPNPATNNVTIKYQLRIAGDVSLGIYDVSGRCLTALTAGYRSPGDHVLRWNGRDERGVLLPTGTYMLRIEASGSISGRMLQIVR